MKRLNGWGRLAPLTLLAMILPILAACGGGSPATQQATTAPAAAAATSHELQGAQCSARLGNPIRRSTAKLG